MPYVTALVMGCSSHNTTTDILNLQLIDPGAIDDNGYKMFIRHYTVKSIEGMQYYIHYKLFIRSGVHGGGYKPICSKANIGKYINNCRADKHYLVAYDSTFTNPRNMTRDDVVDIVPLPLSVYSKK